MSEFIGNYVSTQIVLILLATSVFGAFGGAVAHFINNEKKQLLHIQGTENEDVQWFVYPSLFQSACIGIAGSIAFLFFIIAVGGLTNFQNLTEQIRSIAVSVIAGFGARSLLPRMVNRLAEQVERANTNAAEAKDRAESASESAREAIEKAKQAQISAEDNLRKTEEKLELIHLNSKLGEAAHPDMPSDIWRSTLNRAMVFIAEDRASAVTWINVARVQRWHNQLDEAIKTLDDLIKIIESGKFEKDDNYARAYYNRSCYNEKKYKEGGENYYRENCIKDIQQCLKNTLDKNYILQHMLIDPDLRDVISLDEFKAAIR